MKVQPYISSEDGKLFDIIINDSWSSFTILELTETEITKLLEEIKLQVAILKKAYKQKSG